MISTRDIAYRKEPLYSQISGQRLSLLPSLVRLIDNMTGLSCMTRRPTLILLRFVLNGSKTERGTSSSGSIPSRKLSLAMAGGTSLCQERRCSPLNRRLFVGPVQEGGSRSIPCGSRLLPCWPCTTSPRLSTTAVLLSNLTLNILPAS